MKNQILRIANLAAIAALVSIGCNDNSVGSANKSGRADDFLREFNGKPAANYTLAIEITPSGTGNVSRNPNKVVYTAGDSVTVTADANPGYMFVNWSGVLNAGTPAVTVVMDRDLTLTANFQTRTYSLTVNTDVGGSVSRSPGKTAYAYEDEVTVTAEANPGYTFTGWSGASESANPEINVIMNDDLTLTAHFRSDDDEPPPPPETFTLTVNVSGNGSVSRNPDKTPYTAGETVRVTAAPAEGYRFARWTGASTSTDSTVTITMDEEKTLTAVFEIIKYTVTFNANGGSGAPDAQTANYGSSITLPVQGSMTKSGSTFAGWNTASDGTGTNYSAGSYFTVKSEDTLYAVWNVVSTPITYTITFDANGGAVSPTSDTTDVNGELVSLPTPTRDNYTFSGWWTRTTGGDSVTVSRVYTANTTIYARWEEVFVQPVTYTLTVTSYPTNGGTTTPSESQSNITAGTPVNISATAASGYTFANWTVTTGFAAIANANSAVTTVTLSTNAMIRANFTLKNVTPPSGETFTDNRDGKEYRWVQIGSQVWMAENLNYDADGSKCYGNSADSCAKYGRLYNWSTAMGGKASSSASPSGVPGVCPAGWHIPSEGEWLTLVLFVGSGAGRKLKSQNDWYDCGTVGSGKSYVCEDEYGWSALPGGYGNSDGSFHVAGIYGLWWSATENDANYARNRVMDYLGNVLMDSNVKADLFSVRCIQDN